MAAIQFTALIRLPFARGDFVDPPQADWSAAKDRALWKVISKSSKTSDLNWVELATRFQVPPTFLLQQAAWLYERHLDHVRTQMKKVGHVNAATVSGFANIQSGVGGIPMQRTGSAGSKNSRAPSSLTVRQRDSPTPRQDVSTTAPTLSRTPSTNTITQSRGSNQPASTRAPSSRPVRPPVKNSSRPDQASPIQSSSLDRSESLDTESPDAIDLSSSSSSESDKDNPIHRSQLFKRPPRFQKQRPRELVPYDETAEEGDDAENSEKLPFAHATDEAVAPFANSARNPSSTSRHKTHSKDPLDARNIHGRDRNAGRAMKYAMEKGMDASSSMASSASDAPSRPGPLSPKHRSEIARQSPRKTRSKKDGSEGTPSMGSSFSDIDDASISQSALEEALLSNIQHGRMSTLSQLRSRYL
ncbi:hypothetical protein BDV96DRAFT_586200 [Lophiotrema nucula]|uniref:Autophagy-related protein 29 n=1 Tax=Lophiotrema nucula TaxID=690887 RepID=A0A6A5YQA4_9PLEO|nr:hypothetical protein BDV96DRAFT_586200 [Lophiotrema nucula]